MEVYKEQILDQLTAIIKLVADVDADGQHNYVLDIHTARTLFPRLLNLVDTQAAEIARLTDALEGMDPVKTQAAIDCALSEELRLNK